MPFPVPHFQPKPVRIPPAIIRAVAREDVLWDRPIFKAPPLVVFLPPPRRDHERRLAAGGSLDAA
jgi:hypothetical protein